MATAVSLNTIITANLSAQPLDQARGQAQKPKRALVLMGGGARTAYQVGVLRALGAMLALQPGVSQKKWPLAILVGTSAGALNSSFLAARAHEGLGAIDSLAQFWRSLRSDRVYTLNVPAWMRTSRLLTAVALGKRASTIGGVLDNIGLIDSLHRAIALGDIERNLNAPNSEVNLDVLAVTASSYSSGTHWTFCQTPANAHLPGAATQPRAGRRVHNEPITIEHLAASSAIPLLFPAASLYVDGRREFFGDGSMRQVSPLSVPMKLGATHVLAIGVGQPDRATLGGAGTAEPAMPSTPSLGLIAGHAMASVFHDTLSADVEQAQRVNATLASLPPELRQAVGYRPVEVLQITPSQSLDALATQHFNDLPKGVRNVLAGLGAKGSAGAALASYLLFEPSFTTALVSLGEQDAYAQKDALMAFFGVN